MCKLDNKAVKSRQRDVDISNQKLLKSIMSIMKRRNQSVENARRIPENVIGGAQSVMSKQYDLFKNQNSMQDSLFEETP